MSVFKHYFTDFEELAISSTDKKETNCIKKYIILSEH